MGGATTVDEQGQRACARIAANASQALGSAVTGGKRVVGPSGWAGGVGLLVAAALGALTGVTIMLAGVAFPHHFAGAAEDRFVAMPQFRFWVFLIAMQSALWAVCAVPLLQMNRTLKARYQAGRLSIARVTGSLAILLYGSIIVITMWTGVNYELPYHRLRMLILGLIGASVALVGGCGLARISAALRDLRQGAVRQQEELLQRYTELRETLLRILFLEGALIGSAILTTGALRNAVESYRALPAVRHHVLASGTSFPHEYVLAYGIFYTALLAAIYVPTYVRLSDLGRELSRSVCPAPCPGTPEWSAWYDVNSKMEQHLQLGISTTQSFKAGIAILSPLATSVVGLLIGSAS